MRDPSRRRDAESYVSVMLFEANTRFDGPHPDLDAATRVTAVGIG